MKDRKIEVISYLGYKGDERPIAFIFEGTRIEVVELVRSWVEEEMPGQQRLRCFRVMGSDAFEYVLCLREREKEWVLREK